MGKKRVIGITGMFLAAATLAGCQNSRGYQNSGATAQTRGWGGSSAMARQGTNSSGLGGGTTVAQNGTAGTGAWGATSGNGGWNTTGTAGGTGSYAAGGMSTASTAGASAYPAGTGSAAGSGITPPAQPMGKAETAGYNSADAHGYHAADPVGSTGAVDKYPGSVQPASGVSGSTYGAGASATDYRQSQPLPAPASGSEGYGATGSTAGSPGAGMPVPGHEAPGGSSVSGPSFEGVPPPPRFRFVRPKQPGTVQAPGLRPGGRGRIRSRTPGVQAGGLDQPRHLVKL